IPVSSDLIWTPCFEKFTCANLQVPLDYEEPSAGQTVIAFIKKDANTTGPTQDILYNPGGPGGSGIGAFLGAHKRLSEALGPQYNLVSFDPRGVNNSGPVVDYYECLERDLKNAEPTKQAWCASKIASGKAQYIGTPAVAQDLLRYIEKRNVELGRSAQEARLWYYGASYGTMIGTTFAALYPDRVGRLVLDGVVRADLHYQGRWSEYPRMTEDIMGQFAPHCLGAGPQGCKFCWKNDTVTSIEERIQKILGSLKTEPLAWMPDRRRPKEKVYMTYDHLHHFMFQATYHPVSYFPLLASVLLDLERGDASSLGKISNQTSKGEVEYWPHQAISCVDSWRTFAAASEKRADDPVVHFDKMKDAAELCRNAWFTKYPPASQQFPGFSMTITAFPILFVSSAMDPVTPMQGARAMSQFFPGSVVMEQTSIGHCAISGPSNCTISRVQGYLSGQMPPIDAVCPAKELPFAAVN
ncbi:Alpha/Beta hydrolase protein, partial [Massariosphaeria phaeospora]